MGESEVYRAQVHSRAKLAYNSVAAWLEGTGADAARRSPPSTGWQRICGRRTGSPRPCRSTGTSRGALSLETIEAQPVFEGDLLSGIEIEEKNRAKNIIEDFMIAANGVAARFLASKGPPPSAASCARPNAGTVSSR